MDKVLIDSDVILDLFFDRKPFAEYSSLILSLCESRKIKGFLTPLIYSNVYYLLRQTAKHDKVIEKLRQLLKITDVLQMDREVVENALNSGFKDFEDSLQNYSAINNGNIDLILTRNLKDYKTSELGVFTPETYLKSRNASR
ncbi:MAG: PIN domain-containing protein [Cyclobacteriaceae bacterium]|nr:PIN domain-containing protein [Cyclobacteriaceae bacterium]